MKVLVQSPIPGFGRGTQEEEPMSLSGVKGSVCTGQVSGAQGVFAVTSGELLVDPAQGQGWRWLPVFSGSSSSQAQQS